MERLYERYGPGLLAFAAATLRDRPAAEDVLQQVFLRLLSQGMKLPSDEAPYLYRAVRNTALNEQRRRARLDAVEEHEPWLQSPDGNRDAALELQRELAELPDEQREVLVLHTWAGMTFEEIAGVLEIPAATAASRYRYGLEKLQDRLAPKEPRHER